MNFTREPIIETIISPKEGYKLLVRSSKTENGEEHYVDAVEVVSFGRAFFFRSMERPKAFLVPVSDYEILEVKEARVALKNASHEKTIKIGGGREAPLRPAQKEPKESPPVEPPAPAAEAEETILETAVESRMDRKRDRRRHRRRRGREDREMEKSQEKESETPSEEETKAPTFSTLIPPPSTLISETLGRYREKDPTDPKEQQDLSDIPPVEPSEEEEPGADSFPLHRNPTQEEITTLNVSYFIPFSGNDPLF